MNILFVIADLGFGGAQQVVVNLVNEFIRENHNVWILILFAFERPIGSTGLLPSLGGAIGISA